MLYETPVDEKVAVWAFFDSSTGSAPYDNRTSPIHIFPIAMNWRRRLIKFQKLIFASSKTVGQVKFLNLVCASDTANFELEYNTSNYLWKLKKIMPVS